MSKKGFQNGRQRYKCASCGKIFQGGDRLNSEQIWKEYTEGKQTYTQLALKYGCSNKTIERKLDLVRTHKENTFPSVVNLLMDTTYFVRSFGVMVFKDGITGTILYKDYVKQETNQLYLKGVEEISRRGIKIQSIICDGRKGLIQLFDSDIPVQMCCFHQVAIIRRYLTKKPKMQASKELWDITLLLKKTDKESFVGALSDWYSKWKSFLNEQKSMKKVKKICA